jgi:5-methylcytosine-specific restriction enzyme subunit McrC
VTNNITLFEHEKYQYEVGANNRYLRESKHLTLTPMILQSLEELNEDKQFLDIGRKTITPLNYVGVVRINDLTIQIFPKLFRGGISDCQQEIIASNLLVMLSYTENITIKEISYADLKKNEEYDLFEIFIYLFAKQLNNLIQTTQRREYINRTDNLRFIKGRIDRTYCCNPACLHIVPCTFYDFSVDNLLNRTLLYTCYLMARTTESFETIRILKRIMNIMAGVTLTSISTHEADKIVFNRLNQAFRPFIGTCKLFLSHSTFTLQASDLESFSFLIPMEKLFEQFISYVLSDDPEFFFGINTSIYVQKDIGTLTTDEKGRNFFPLIPDIVLRKDGQTSIIDLKYKLLDDKTRNLGVISSDMYQMYAYANIAPASSCMLLYPDIIGIESKRFMFNIQDKEGHMINVPLYIQSIGVTYVLASEDGWFEFRAALKRIVSKLISKEPNTPIILNEINSPHKVVTE